MVGLLLGAPSRYVYPYPSFPVIMVAGYLIDRTFRLTEDEIGGEGRPGGDSSGPFLPVL